MEWVMVICTAGWIMCGQQITQVYSDKETCFAERKAMYELQGKEEFKYITCRPKQEKE